MRVAAGQLAEHQQPAQQAERADVDLARPVPEPVVVDRHHDQHHAAPAMMAKITWRVTNRNESAVRVRVAE